MSIGWRNPLKMEKKAIIKITNSTFQFTPDTDRFVQDFSLPNVIDNYNAIFSQITKHLLTCVTIAFD